MIKQLTSLFTCAMLSIAPCASDAADDSGLLTGTSIGSPAIDNASGTISETVNTPADAFDGDFNTFYASYASQYAWVGLDLGSPHVISRVSIVPAANPIGDMRLGVFEGANQPDFSDAIPFFIIKDAPIVKQVNTYDVACSRGFRYVRYVGPVDSHCNVAELAFYGTEGEGDDSQLYQMAVRHSRNLTRTPLRHSSMTTSKTPSTAWRQRSTAPTLATLKAATPRHLMWMPS